VGFGADRPLTRGHGDAYWFHGKDGLGDPGYPAPKRKPEREHGVDAIPRLAHAEPGLTLVPPPHSAALRRPLVGSGTGGMR
jgi:inosine-uridine nucleoside N-ribohydrolase